MVTGNGHNELSSNLDEAVASNTLGKGMNPIILSPAVSK